MLTIYNGDAVDWSIPQTHSDLTGMVPLAAIPSLTQNTTGTAAGLTGTPSVSITNLTVSGTTSFGAASIALAAISGAAPLASPTFTGTVGAAAITATGLTTTATFATTGLCTKYDNVATTGQGLPSLVGVVTTGTHTAAIAATSLLAAPVAGGFYRVSAYMKVTVATSTPIAGPITITYKDSDGVAQSVVMMMQNATGAVATSTGSTTTTPVMGTIEIYCGSGTAIQYAVAFSGTGTYELVLKCESF